MHSIYFSQDLGFKTRDFALYKQNRNINYSVTVTSIVCGDSFSSWRVSDDEPVVSKGLTYELSVVWTLVLLTSGWIDFGCAASSSLLTSIMSLSFCFSEESSATNVLWNFGENFCIPLRGVVDSLRCFILLGVSTERFRERLAVDDTV